MNKKSIKKNLAPYAFLLIFIIGCLIIFKMFNVKVNELSYDEFMKDLNGGKVTELTITPKVRTETYMLEGKLSDYAENESFILYLPQSEEFISKITAAKEGTSNFELKINTDAEASSWLAVLVDVVPIVILAGVTIWIFTRQLGGGSKSMDFGKSRAKLVEESRATFKDVAGLTEEKEEVQELIDFLKNPKKFTSMGARIPKGVLLVGPPGTGKTLLARAVAGEAKVPFYYISGSDFVELFVGIGASRVRDMFKQAKMNAPCLIFIDEIDAVGRQRGTGLGGGHDEREQTLNQLLTEMDGFGANEGIIIIAATNRPDVLDPALLRPGRFDRQVTVSLPDKNARIEILKVHAKNKVLAKNITLEYLAKRTPGFSGADLENLLNEAALLAVRRNKKEISMAEIDEATDRVLMGPAKVTKKYTDKEKKLVAFHEAGHAVMGLKLDGANEVQKITIIPRGHAGGYTMMTPKEESFNYTKNELLESICGLLGGRVAEEVTFGEITTGAHDDFKKATKIARSMVTEYGMSSLGPMMLEEPDGNTFLGRDYTKNRNISDTVAHEIDEEMRSIINNCYEKTKKIISENKDLLSLIANTLLEEETITKEEIDFLVEQGHLPEAETKKEEEQVNGVKEDTKKSKKTTKKEDTKTK
ncbi:MAG: ATP-dependent zinc metalloprotease FtsH [Bacilli bacterium]|nr:ATP-dependent zinc metalloprotease FtsH [Clostridium sp.]MDY2804261.1 ATP-dependent zinc metalloprotease FtsH [Bacilli bacterium]